MPRKSKRVIELENDNDALSNCIFDLEQENKTLQREINELKHEIKRARRYPTASTTFLETSQSADILKRIDEALAIMALDVDVINISKRKGEGQTHIKDIYEQFLRAITDLNKQLNPYMKHLACYLRDKKILQRTEIDEATGSKGLTKQVERNASTVLSTYGNKKYEQVISKEGLEGVIRRFQEDPLKKGLS